MGELFLIFKRQNQFVKFDFILIDEKYDDKEEKAQFLSHRK